MAVAVAGLILTLPALWEVNIGTAEEPILTVTAFFAVVSIGVLGLYLAFAIPIFLRWRAGSSFKQGSWNLGNKWKWMAPLAVIEILLTSVYFILPLYPAGAPGFMRGFLGAPDTDGSAVRLEVRELRPACPRRHLHRAVDRLGAFRPSTGSPGRSGPLTCQKACRVPTKSRSSIERGAPDAGTLGPGGGSST